MLENLSDPWKLIFTILLFPLALHEPFLNFFMSEHESIWVPIAKALFLLLPALGFMFSCWATVLAIPTIIIRANRSSFVSIMFVTWWDLGRSVLNFWGGIIKFIYLLIGNIILLLRLGFVLFWISLQDIFLSPIRVIKSVGNSYAQEGTPWLAVGLLCGWSIIEATIFTYVITETAMNILANFAQQELEPMMVQPILFLMMTVFILGSYAVVTELGNAIRRRNWYMIAFIAAFELCVAAFEVLFLYREFVDALLLGFQAHSADFKFGIGSIIGISTVIWFGIRGMTWFLFAESGSPTIMAIIQRTGLQITGKGTTNNQPTGVKKQVFEYTSNAIDQLKKDSSIINARGNEILEAFMLPGLQIIAVCINFCTVILSSKHLFNLPFKSLSELLSARDIILKATQK